MDERSEQEKEREEDKTERENKAIEKKEEAALIAKEKKDEDAEAEIENGVYVIFVIVLLDILGLEVV